MAVTLDQASLGTGNASAATTTSMTTTAAVASGGMIALLAGRFFSGTSTISVTTTGGLTWNTAHNVTNGNVRIYLFYAFAPSGLVSGTTLTVTHTNASDCIIGAASYLGVDSAVSPTSFNGTGSAVAAWTSGSVTGNSGDALIGGCFSDGAAASSVPAGSENERIDKNVAGQSETLVLEDILSISGATAITGTWNAATTSVAVAASFQASGGGGAAASVNTPSFQAIPFMGGH